MFVQFVLLYCWVDCWYSIFEKTDDWRFTIYKWPEDFFSEICIAPESPDQVGGYRKPSPKFEIEMIEKYS